MRTRAVSRVVDAVVARCARETPCSGLLFVTGALAPKAEAIARELARTNGVGSWLVAPVPGVLTERGEVEQEPAATGIVLPIEQARIVVGDSSRLEFGEALLEQLAQSPGATSLILLRGDQTDDGWLAALDARLGQHEERLFGGGTLPRLDMWLAEGGKATPGGAAAVVIERPWLGRIGASSACRLLSPLVAVTATRGSMILELDGAPALSVLNSCTQELDEQPLVLLAVAGQDDPLAPEGRQLALRALHGVDPVRGGLLIGDPLPEGTRVAFAVRDAHGARTDLQAHLRTLRRNCAGASPEFGIYVACAGRGRSLYQTANVDVRLIQEAFPEMPLVGLHSTFELAPLSGRLTPQIYTGVLGVFCAPS